MSWASMGVPTPSMGRSVEAPPIATRADGVSGRNERGLRVRGERNLEWAQVYQYQGE